MTTALPVLTSSRLKTARACQRLHRYQYTLGYRPLAESSAARFGTLVHLALEAWMRSTNDRLAAALQVLELTEADPFDRARAAALVTGYHFRWADEPMKVLTVEAKFETDLRNPSTGHPSRTWRVGGKLDGIVEVNDDPMVLEHKVTSEDMGPGTTYWARLKLDGQISMYFVGANALGFDVKGCIYDVLKRPAQRPYKATPLEDRKLKKDGTPYASTRMSDETPEEFKARVMEAIAENPTDYYSRGTVVRLEGEVEEALTDVWQTARILHENELRGFAPRTVEACIRYGSPCPFLPVCSGEASLEDATLYRKLTDVHPELSEAA